jgi:hypothetical protein
MGGSSCFGFRPEAARPIEACSLRSPTITAASTDAAEGDPLPLEAEPPARDGAAPGEAGGAEEDGCGGARAMKDSEVNDALVQALLGLVDGGAEAVAGFAGCHWETVCVTDGVTVYRAR